MKKRTIILFVCLLIICIVLVLNGTLFIVREVDVVDWEQGAIESEEIVELSKVKDRNIFTISEKIVRDNVEKAMPHIKVVSVVREFPSRIKVVVLNRLPLIAVNYSGGYAIVDREGRVFNTTDDLSIYDYDLTILEGVNLAKVVKGEDLAISSEHFSRLIQIVNTFETSGDNGYVGENFCKTVSKIAFSTTNDMVHIYMREGMVLRFDASTDCKLKVRSLVSWFNNGRDSDGNPIDRTSGLYTTKDNEKNPDGSYKIYKVSQP